MDQETLWSAVAYGVGGITAVLAMVKKHKDIYNLILSIHKFIFKRFHIRNFKMVDLKNHFIFNEIDSCIKYKIPNIKYICRIRKEIFSTVLTLKLEALKNHLMEIVNIGQDELNKKTKEEIQEIFELSLSKNCAIWRENCANAKVFPFVMEQYIEVIQTTENIYKKLIQRTVLSDIVYESNCEKIFSIMTSMSVVYILLLLDMEDVFIKINGGFLDKTFNGISCKGYQECGLCRLKTHIPGSRP